MFKIILIDTNQEDRYFGAINLTNPAVIKSQPICLFYSRPRFSNNAGLLPSRGFLQEISQIGPNEEEYIWKLLVLVRIAATSNNACTLDVVLLQNLKITRQFAVPRRH